MMRFLVWFSMMVLPCEAVAQRGWPRSVDFSRGLVAVQSEHELEKGRYVYKTKGAALISDLPLDRAELNDLAKVLESVEPAIRSLPLPYLPVELSTKRRRLQVYSKDADYLLNGGLPGTVGRYSGRRRETVLLRSGLFGKTAPGQAKELPVQDRYDVLVHEYSHQVMARWAGILPPWLYEGHAEYLAVAHDRPGHYQFHGMEEAVVEHIRKYVVRSLRVLPLPSLESLIKRSTRDWSEAINEESDSNYHQYAASLLLTHFYYHLDQEPGFAIRRYLQALLAGSDPRAAREEHLLAKRDWQAIESRLVEYWKGHGLGLRFDR